MKYVRQVITQFEYVSSSDIYQISQVPNLHLNVKKTTNPEEDQTDCHIITLLKMGISTRFNILMQIIFVWR